MGDGLPQFDEGDVLSIGGDPYRVVGIDPLDSERNHSYTLESPDNTHHRLDCQHGRGQFTLIRVESFDPDEVEVKNND